MSEVAKALEFIKKNNAEFVDLRFTDTYGKEQHISIPVSAVNEEFFVEGKMFDASSMVGWRGINESDMTLLPDASTAILDPFFVRPTVILRCDVIDPKTNKGYDRDPRCIAKRAEEYLLSTGIADVAYFGPEPEFFIFDDVKFWGSMNSCGYKVDSEEAAWNSGSSYDDGNYGHRANAKRGYFPVPPVDSQQDIRSEMCNMLENMGMKVEAHHHEVATGGQGEISTRFNSLTRKADELQTLKYIVHNVAHLHGKTATFMPKPIVNDNGSGMHCHQSLAKDGENIFAGDKYAGLSQIALYYIGGIIKHAKALNAFCNASTNSYKRLVPGFEAPVFLAYSASNRSASVRIPHVASEKAKRIEVRFPDVTANPYLAFSAMLMAGLDGIQNKIDPGNPVETDLYKHKGDSIPTVARSLEEAMDALDKDRGFLLAGGVFNDHMIDVYMGLKRRQIQKLNMAIHPVEFEMYYSL
ncbi:MAG: type I glutamate--ammonia ligase [Thiotrichales bacterium]|nr:MAG: type I glutamate--ammonia ligase [Thiotrichales bacterium]